MIYRRAAMPQLGLVGGHRQGLRDCPDEPDASPHNAAHAVEDDGEAFGDAAGASRRWSGQSRLADDTLN
jgi:hypothetical protein